MIIMMMRIMKILLIMMIKNGDYRNDDKADDNIVNEDDQ